VNFVRWHQNKRKNRDKHKSKGVSAFETNQGEGKEAFRVTIQIIGISRSASMRVDGGESK